MIYQKAINLAPTYADALCNLGICLSLQEKYEDAEVLYKKALAINPGELEIIFYLADSYYGLGKYREARNLLLPHIKEHSPLNRADVLNLIGKTFQKEGSADALQYYRKALFFSDKTDESLNNIGSFLYEKRKVQLSIKFFNDAIRSNEGNSNVEINLAYAYLILGNFKEGWEKHEYRWKVDPLNKVRWPIEGRDLWEGQQDRDVVLWREQGIGDELIFLGLVPEARACCKKVSVYIDERLIPLCERSMPDVRFLSKPEQIGEREFDYHLPMGSLPRLFRSSEEDFQKTVKSYLKADLDRVEVLRRDLNVGDRKIIGISWKSIKSLNHLKKSLTLTEFGKIFQGLDIVLLNLQYGEVDEEIKAFERDTGIEIIQCSSVDNREDLDGLAALIELCDLVVSTSNVTIHLAGALGKETWVLLPYVANFWWLLERTDSVWYPSLTLYRQKKLKDWDSIAIELAEDLKKKFNT